jgi:hypothetical protein
MVAITAQRKLQAEYCTIAVFFSINDKTTQTMSQDGWFKATFEQNISLPVRQSTYDHLVPSVHVKAVRIEALRKAHMGKYALRISATVTVGTLVFNRAFPSPVLCSPSQYSEFTEDEVIAVTEMSN